MSQRKMMLVVLCVGLFAGAGNAMVLLQEDWNSGVVDPLKWEVDGSSTFAYDLGLTGQGDSGDYAYFLRNPSYTYVTGIQSAMSFSRSDQLVATFKLLRDPATNGIGYSGICGPWVSRDTLSGTYPTLEQIEAGMSRSANNGYVYYVEGTSAFDTVPFSSAFYNAYDAATIKAMAVTVKVTMGVSTGAKFEWSLDGVNFTTEFDTIGMAAGYNYNGSNLVSSSDPLWLYFAGAGDGATFAGAIVDDIVVESIPEPVSLALLGLGGMVALSRKRRM